MTAAEKYNLFLLPDRKSVRNLLEEVFNLTEYKTNDFSTTGRYDLSYGEYSRPSYSVRKLRGIPGFGIYVSHYYYPGTSNIPENGFMSKLDVEECLMRLNVPLDSVNRIFNSAIDIRKVHSSVIERISGR